MQKKKISRFAFMRYTYIIRSEDVARMKTTAETSVTSQNDRITVIIVYYYKWIYNMVNDDNLAVGSSLTDSAAHARLLLSVTTLHMIILSAGITNSRLFLRRISHKTMFVENITDIIVPRGV